MLYSIMVLVELRSNSVVDAVSLIPLSARRFGLKVWPASVSVVSNPGRQVGLSG